MEKHEEGGNEVSGGEKEGERDMRGIVREGEYGGREYERERKRRERESQRDSGDKAFGAEREREWEVGREGERGGEWGYGAESGRWAQCAPSGPGFREDPGRRAGRKRRPRAVPPCPPRLGGYPAASAPQLRSVDCIGRNGASICVDTPACRRSCWSRPPAGIAEHCGY